MAKTKLTLNADREVVEKARLLAKENNTSISAMFSRIILAMAERKRPKVRLGPLTRKATGLISVSAGFDERKALEDALAEKYGIDA